MQLIQTISAPFDVGASIPGAQHGPQAFLDFGLINALRGIGISIEQGPTCIAHEASAPSEMATFKNGKAVYAAVQSVYDATLDILNQRYTPLILGGDHSLAIGSIGAAATHAHHHNKSLKVLWIDAHADFNTQKTSPSGNIHGMPAAVLTQDGPQSLKNLIAPNGFIKPESILQLGIRSVDMGEQKRLDASGIHVITPTDIRVQGIDHTIQTIIDFIGDVDCLHISFDVDGLDPQHAPGVGTTEPDGLELQDIEKLFLRLHRYKQPMSMDIYEYNPTLDIQQTTVKSMLSLLKVLFAGEKR